MRIDQLFLLSLSFWIASVAGFGTTIHQLGARPRVLPIQNIALFLSSSDKDDDEKSINVLGTQMECCCSNVRGTGVGTGFYRNGYCSTGAQDVGRHTVCVQVTDDFLKFSAKVGNDLSTPMPQYMFPGLKEGDLWCLCAQRWAQAYQFGKAPKLYLRATHEKTLDYVEFEVLREYALDGEAADQEKQALDDQRDQLEKLFGKQSSSEAEESSS